MRKCLILTVCLILLQSWNLKLCASAVSEFETIDLSQNEIDKIWQNINVNYSLDVVSLNDIELPIVSFDVSENGIILLGFKGNKVAVVDGNVVTNFFEFSNDGSYFVRWNDANIQLLLVRGSIVVELSINGSLVSMTKANDNSIQNNTLWNEISAKKQMDIGEYSYFIKNEMKLLTYFLPYYSQLIKTDSQGNTTVIYDVSKFQLMRVITLIIVTIVFFIIVLLIIYKKTVETRGRLSD